MTKKIIGYFGLTRNEKMLPLLTAVLKKILLKKETTIKRGTGINTPKKDTITVFFDYPNLAKLITRW
jgi:hypothetical protein